MAQVWKLFFHSNAIYWVWSEPTPKKKRKLQPYVRNESTREYKQVGVERTDAMKERDKEEKGGCKADRHQQRTRTLISHSHIPDLDTYRP